MNGIPKRQVAEAIRAHTWYFVGNLGVPGMPDRRGYRCGCGWSTGDPDEPGFEEPHEHVAQAAIDALQLTEETTTRPVLVYDDPPAPKRTNLVNAPEFVWATHFEFVPSSRLTSEWEPRMAHADSMRPWVEENR